MTKYIAAPDLARMLGLEEDEIYEMARLRGFPFAVTSASPRRFVIEERDFNQWRLAVLDREP
jgi:hypothetical protein